MASAVKKTQAFSIKHKFWFLCFVWEQRKRKEGFVPVYKFSFTSHAERNVAQPKFTVKKH